MTENRRPYLSPGIPMNKSTSIYLDLMRFLAAVVVYMQHLNDWSGKSLAFFTPFLSAQAVVLFFVLSGFVIAYVSGSRESDWKTYVVNRAARIYSVALLALIFTFAIDATTPSLPNVIEDNLTAASKVQQFLAGLLFLNEIWGHHIPVGSNVPYWSLGYEVPYYIGFGLLLFPKRHWKLAGVLAIVAFGPRIALLSVIWVMGIAAYHATRLRLVGQRFGGVLFFGSFVAWIALIAHVSGPDYPLFWRKLADLPVDYASGALFSLTIVGFDAMTREATVFGKSSEAVIRWCAGVTFTLYLFHTPVAQAVNYLMPLSIRDIDGIILITVTVMVSSFAIAEVTERRKRIFQAGFRRLLPSSQNPSIARSEAGA